MPISLEAPPGSLVFGKRRRFATYGRNIEEGENAITVPNHTWRISPIHVQTNGVFTLTDAQQKTVTQTNPTLSLVGLIPAGDLFLKADAGITSDANGVSAWADQSGNGADFVQTTNSKKPATVSSAFGSKDGVQFDGTDDWLEADGTPALGGLIGSSGYVAALVRIDTLLSANGANSLLTQSDVDASDDFWEASPQRFNSGGPWMMVRINTGSGQNRLVGDETLTATTYIMEWWSNGSNFFMALNGVDQSLTVENGADNGAWWGDLSAPDNTTLGARRLSGGESNFLQGTVGLVWARSGSVPSSSDRELIRTYFDDWAGGGILP